MTCTSANRAPLSSIFRGGFPALLVAQTLASCAAPAPSTTIWTADSACPDSILSEADSQTAVYVDANAGSSGDGSDELPYADLQEGLDAVEAGDVVVIRKGTYQGAFEVNRERVRLMGQCRDQVFLVGDHLSDVDPVLNVRADGVQVQGLTVQDGAPFVAISPEGAAESQRSPRRLDKNRGSHYIVGVKKPTFVRRTSWVGVIPRAAAPFQRRGYGPTTRTSPGSRAWCR